MAKKSDKSISAATVEQYEFQPIDGYPMLNWKGKRPFTSTQYYPAQLKESYGKPSVDGWMNRIYWGDNLQVMSHLLKEFRGKVDLVYIDPPFDSKAVYKKRISVRKSKIEGDVSSFEEKQYSDLWTNDSYLQFMYDRLALIRELLSDSGVLFLHCDWHRSHLLRCILDEIFGYENFVSEVIWRRSTSTGSSKALSNKFPSNHDTILMVSKTGSYKYKRQYKAYDKEYLARFRYDDKDGRGLYRIDNLSTYSQETLARLKADNRIVIPKTKGANFGYKRYLKEVKGVVIDDVWSEEMSDLWLDINFINPMATEGEGYPTQKPEELLQRIVTACTDEGDLIMDCFAGAGTTAAVAAKMNRRFISADINSGAIRTTINRMAGIQKMNNAVVGTSFYCVNDYDIFRNPTEARDLIANALELNQLKNSFFDGEKDGRLYKIMPTNRIATRSDLTDLMNAFDYKMFERRQQKNPNAPVERLTLVCMGHEADLKAHLEKEVPYKLDVLIVDLLRDRSDLSFKREPEARIVIKDNTLIIERFYPMNLLQKLSIQKEKAGNWRELVESVLIDWNYDGAVLEPSVIDIPVKDGLVKGEYEVPSDSGTIRVKITDLLSESIEVEVVRG